MCLTRPSTTVKPKAPNRKRGVAIATACTLSYYRHCDACSLRLLHFFSFFCSLLSFRAFFSALRMTRLTLSRPLELRFSFCRLTVAPLPAAGMTATAWVSGTIGTTGAGAVAGGAILSYDTTDPRAS